MGQIILTGELLAKFQAAAGKPELRDAQGVLVGYYEPAVQKKTEA